MPLSKAEMIATYAAIKVYDKIKLYKLVEIKSESINFKNHSQVYLQLNELPTKILSTNLYKGNLKGTVQIVLQLLNIHMQK